MTPEHLAVIRRMDAASGDLNANRPDTLGASVLWDVCNDRRDLLAYVDELTRKGEELCCAHGDALMGIEKYRAAIAAAIIEISKLRAVITAADALHSCAAGEHLKREAAWDAYCAAREKLGEM